MTYSHFLTLCEYLDKCEREKAKYSAFAFNNPKLLFEQEQKEQKQLDLRKPEDREKLLMFFNGK